MDTKDKQILDLMKYNSRLSTQKISKRTGIPITTVHHRIKKLENEGIIKRYTLLLNNNKIGKNLAAYVAITVNYDLLKRMNITQHDLAKKLKRNESVEEVSMVTGGTDIILKIRVSGIEKMDDFITTYLRNVDGIERTQTMVILHEIE